VRRLSDLEDGVHAVLERRLDSDSTAPLAVGLSGGGDSLALLILTLGWACPRGRQVLALTVDHRLQPGSAVWTHEALAAAARLGAEPRALAWDGPKPAAGLPAAARDARHRLLAEAARGLGSQVVLLGHTADDLAEAAAMRSAGSSVGDPREWAPSPVWPEGRGVFLLRPLLCVARADLRAFLRARGEAWFDDPANDDARFARARARALSPLAGGGVAVGRANLDARLLSAACLCAAGHDRPPRRREVEALLARLRAGGHVAATLAGARIEADEGEVRFAREIGRGGLPVLALPPGEPTVWDGRYEITAARPGLTVRALAGVAARLPAAERAALRRIPALERPSLPAIVDPQGGVSCPILAERDDMRFTPLAPERLRAACGVVTREGEGGDAARGETERGVLSWMRPVRSEGR
jgi:tRNA(Ile)-lysidine synthase